MDRMDVKVHVLTIGYGNNLFEFGNPERERLILCAAHVEALHTVILGSRPGATRSHEGHFFIYPARGYFRVFSLIRAFVCAFRICLRERNAKWVITAQDPFETSLVAYFVSRFFGKRFMVQEHGDFFSTTHWKRESLMNRVRFYVGLFLLRRAWRVRVVSERIKHTLISHGVPEKNIHILSVRSDTSAISHAEPDLTVRASFPLGARIILSAARFVAQKNIPLLIRAFARVAPKFSDARLLLVGNGKEEEHIRSLVVDTPLESRIQFLPWTESFPVLLKSVDIYALSSNYEGWGRVIPEAMAAGLPIITTDVGCVGELMLHKVHGLVVPVDDEVAFVDALTTLLSQPQLMRSFGIAGKETIFALGIMNAETYARAWALLHSPV